MTLDEMNNSGRETEAQAYLEHWLGEARAEGDWKAEMSILSELLGQYRRTLCAEKGIAAAGEAVAMVEQRTMEQSATGATILLNAATTLKAFGKTEESVKLFESVERVYDATLEKEDYRFAGLYNNMAISYAELGRTEEAEDYFYRALEKLEAIENSECDRAVTYCNLAEMTGNDNYLDKAAECLAKAKKDAYYDFTLSKCRGLLGDRIS